jgi:hypothetical protein
MESGRAVHSLTMTRFLRRLEREAHGQALTAGLAAALDVAAGFGVIAVSLLWLSPARIWGLPLAMALGALAGYSLGTRLARYAVPLHRRHSRWALIDGGLLAGVIDEYAYERLPGLERDPLDSVLFRRWRPPRQTESFRRRLEQLLRSWTQCCANLKIPPVPRDWHRQTRMLFAILLIGGGLLVLVWDSGLDFLPGHREAQQILATSTLVYWIIGLVLAPALALVVADGFAAQSGRRLALLDVLDSRDGPPPPAGHYPQLG